MLREITDKEIIIETIKRLDIISELLEEENGKPKYGNKVERDKVIEGFIHSSTQKRVAPYLRLLVYGPGEEIVHQGDWGGNTLYIAVKGILDACITDLTGAQLNFQLHPGAPFGEMSLLAGIERTATISVLSAGEEATVLEISRPALKHLRTLPRFAAALDSAYRDRSLSHMLKAVQDAIHETFAREQFNALSRAAKLMVYGKHHVLCREGERIDKILVIKNGWVRRVRGLAPDQHTSEMVEGTKMGVDFLGEGNCLGLEGKGEESFWNYSAIVMARTEVLELSISQLGADTLLDKVIKTFSRFSHVDDEREVTRDKSNADVLAAAEKEIMTGIVDGNNLLVMDMDLCIRCGNCSLACHKIHGQSRLLRRGIHIGRPLKLARKSTQHVLSPQVCMHCKDPECLTGCPTGAIFRGPDGLIDIKLETCIGCFDCANQCPYDAISMIPAHGESSAGSDDESFTLVGRLRGLLGQSSPAQASEITPVIVASTVTMPAASTVPAVAGTAGKAAASKPAESKGMVAIKCNLCDNTPINPQGARRKAYSCEENCPTGALVRVNPHEYFSEIENTLGIRFHDETHAIGRNIHRSDPIARLWHTCGVLITIALALATIWAMMRYGLDTHLKGTWWTMRWATGLAGFAGIAGTMLYPPRKQIYRKRAGALRYWMLAHIYLGLIAAILLLLHSGSRTGSLLTTALYVVFDLVIVSGLFGIACYLIVPRIMTSIEGEPLLIEDLTERRQELRETLNDLCEKSSEYLRQVITESVRRRFNSFAYLMRQYLRRETLSVLLAEARSEFQTEIYSLSNRDERQRLLEALETAATLRRVDSLIYLHRLLKLWLAPHVIFTSIMLALMLAHIIQAIFFTVR